MTQQPSIDKGVFVRNLMRQEAYEAPVDNGFYLGFYLAGGAMVLSRIEQFANKKSSDVVAVSVKRLFE